LVSDLTVSPADFESQMKYLKDQGFTFLLASQVEDAVKTGKSLPEKSIAITLDDGYHDNFEYARPILKKYGICATIFVVTSVVGDAKHMSWPEIREMHRNPMGYGSHTVTHPDLTRLALDDLDYELRESKRVLESHLLERISAVAYPSGQYNNLVAARTQAAGYQAGWKKGGGPVTPNADRYLLPRVRVHGRTTEADFNRKVWSGQYVVRGYDAVKIARKTGYPLYAKT